LSVLGVWGLDDVAETTYRAMLRNPDFSQAQLAGHLDLDLATVGSAVDALSRVGLVGPAAGGRGVAASPATTLAALVHSELADLEERRARLDAVRASLSGYAADHMVGQARGWASVPFELLSLEQSFAAVEDLQRGTTGEVLSCHTVVDIDVDAPSYVELIEQQLAAGRPMRALYPADVTEDPDRLGYVRRWADAGEQVRLATHPLPSIAVFGADAALVVPDRSGDSPGALIVRAPGLVGLVRELFEAYWSRATPIGHVDVAHGDDDAAQLLALLRLGLKDESIARQLGVSLRTVRRRVALLMADLDATTRFQAGLEAARRGMV
jgi:hypothetical protein